MKSEREAEIQRAYYTQTAETYDQMHALDTEHAFALGFLGGMVDYLQIGSVLDVGSGTGRVLRYLKTKSTSIQVQGIEPVQALREIGHRSGLAEHELVDGDAMNLPFGAGEFDLVCEFAVLHHLRDPNRALKEILRVAKTAVFLSDSNNFGQGSWLLRRSKQSLRRVGLWGFANFLKTRGRGYSYSAGDGIAYSYSVYDSYSLLREQCRSIHFANTIGATTDAYRDASHVAVLGVK